MSIYEQKEFMIILLYHINSFIKIVYMEKEIKFISLFIQFYLCNYIM
jgi:hypothetical protein